VIDAFMAGRLEMPALAGAARAAGTTATRGTGLGKLERATLRVLKSATRR
jgi:hypothetical protein